ncbi:unnamed protein product [Rotaria socialis]
MYDSGVTKIGKYTLLHSGAPSATKIRSAHGVALCLGEQATKIWKDGGSIWEAVSERIITARLQCHPVSITLVSIYSPINPPPGQTTASDNADAFYIDLQRTINKTPRKDILIVMGDFNARVSKQQHLSGSSVVGIHAVDDLNENGQRLIDFCSRNDLIIANTFFEHKAIHQMSWMHPGNKKWHMLDYTLVNRKFRSTIEDVRVHRTAAGVIGTDHHLIRSKVRLHLKSRKKSTAKQSRNLDKRKLCDPATVLAFQAAFATTTCSISTASSTNEKYTELSNIVKELSENFFGVTERQRKYKEWLTNEILDIVNKKSHAFLQWQNHRGTCQEHNYRKQYCTLRKQAKKKVEERQIEYWDELSLEIEQAIKQHDPATAYRMIRRLKGGKAKIEEMPIHDKQGNLLINGHERLRRWSEHFCELLNVPSTVDPSIMQRISIPQLSTEEQNRQDKPPSLLEVEEAIRRMKSGRAPGMDGLSVDVIKAGGRALSTRLHTVFVEIWEEEQTIEDWSTAIIIRLFKNKGDKRDCGNYRGISLLPVASKVFSRLILNRVQKHLGTQIMEQQAGFQSNRSTIDHIFALKLLMEKTRDHNKSLFLCFIDIQKAYDSINREILWCICRHYGLTTKIVRLLQLLYKDSKARVRINGELSGPFDIETGVQQGGIPSPILFNVFFDFVMRQVLDRLVVLNVTGVKLAYGRDFFQSTSNNNKDIEMLALLYADDVVGCFDNVTDLKLFVGVFEEVSQEYGITMSIKKTCVMQCRQLKVDASRKIIKGEEIIHPLIDITIRNDTLAMVDEFCYLGCCFTRTFSFDREIEMRLEKATTAFNMLRHVVWYRATVSIEAKLRIFRSCVLPVLLYGSEVWSLTVALEQRLCAFYHRCLRTIVGTNLWDRMSNEQLFQITGQPSLENILRRNRLRWFGHLNRMKGENDDPSFMKKIMFSYYAESKRPCNVGTFKKWEDRIQDDLEKMNIHNWRRETLDRDSWRRTINQFTQVKPPMPDILNIIQQVKQRAVQRRAITLSPPAKITELLCRNNNNTYTCPNCKKQFKPQGITNHTRSCAKKWCQQHGIQID